MKPLFLVTLALIAGGCATYERPSSRVVPVPEPAIKHAVDSIPAAAETLINQLVEHSKVRQRIRVAFLPVRNSVLDPGVSVSLGNSLRHELVTRDMFEVLRDIELDTVREAIAAETRAAGFIDDPTKVALGRRLGADAVITCTVSDAIQHWQLQVDLTPVTSNVVASSAVCYLPKRLALRSQIYQP